MAADHHVDARHGLGQAHVVALGVAPVLAFLQAAVAESDDHIHLLGFAENLHHFPGSLDVVGERHRTAIGVDDGLLADHPEEAEAHAAALDHEVAADNPILGKALESGQRWVAAGEAGIRGEHRRNAAGFAATPMDLPRPSGP